MKRSQVQLSRKIAKICLVVLALAAIGSFATPSYYLGLSARVMKFVYIILGSVAGLLGITTGLFIHGLIWVHTYSLGVPMFSPYAPKMKSKGIFGIMVEPVWRRDQRSDYQNPKRVQKAAKVSRGWIKGRKDQ